MNKLTEKAFEFSKTGLFSYVDVLVWLDGSRDSVNGIVKRAILSGEILHMHRGLYCLAGKYNRHILDRNSFANLIYGPSYISMETALSIHGWIPEAVHSVISVSQGRAKTFETLARAAENSVITPDISFIGFANCVAYASKHVS